MMDLTEELIKDVVADACGSLVINYQNQEINFLNHELRISMKDIVKKFTGIDFDSLAETFAANKPLKV